ncbi:hypothetical protein [Alicyclobacillus sp. ALC3]|nr:hypothetical protein [Alicyclobacillus sp. ALC3]WDL98123.1 hypothetical protein JC200_05325 [Alicyclobacillus sp. ALC3]
MDLYLDLMKAGWPLYQIDEMDINYFFRLNNRAGKTQLTPIDDIPGL